MKEINKELMLQLKQLSKSPGEHSLSHSSGTDEDFNDFSDEVMQHSRIHHLYHDLYLTDLKTELNTTSLNLKKQKN
jgi:hypothetical protein